jgi:hypothetical protein
VLDPNALLAATWAGPALLGRRARRPRASDSDDGRDRATVTRGLLLSSPSFLLLPCASAPTLSHQLSTELTRPLSARNKAFLVLSRKA